MSNIIKIDNLNKSYGSIKAVNNLSFRVKDGELFSFLGINGAGKSTTINMPIFDTFSSFYQFQLYFI